MKYLKYFENVKIKPISAWIIYGGKENIVTILQKIGKQLYCPCNATVIYEPDIISKTETMNSIHETIVRINDCDLWFNNLGFILYYSQYGFSFSVVVDENEKEKKLKIVNIDGTYEFKGELKIENDELVLDTIEIDTKKYNL